MVEEKTEVSADVLAVAMVEEKTEYYIDDSKTEFLIEGLASVNQANKDGLVYDGNQTDEDGMVEEAYEASNCSKNQQVQVKSTESGPSA